MENGAGEQNQQTQQNQEQSFQSAPSGVSFPTVGQQKKSGGPKTLLIVGILILVAILGFVIYKSATKTNETVMTEPTPYDNLTAPSQETTMTETATPSSTPVAVDKSNVAIQVQNGTGISGEAAYLQTQLGKLGYSNIKVGNASSQDATSTTVSFGSSVDQGVVSEITQELKSLYQDVTTTSSTSTTYDVVIVTGLRKGATAKPSATPASAASPTPSASPST